MPKLTAKSRQMVREARSRGSPPRCFSACNNSRADPETSTSLKRHAMSPTSTQHYTNKLEREILEALETSAGDSVSYETLVHALRDLRFITGKETELVSALWKLLGPDAEGRAAKERIVRILCDIMENVRLKKFAAFRINRLGKLLPHRDRDRGLLSQCEKKAPATMFSSPRVSQKAFSFSPRVSIVSTKLVLESRKRGGVLGLSSPDQWLLQQTLHEEYHLILMPYRWIRGRQSTQIEKELKECTFQPNAKTEDVAERRRLAVQAKAKCEKLFHMAKRKTEDITDEEYQLRKEHEECTFRPSISRLDVSRPQTSLGRIHNVKGSAESVERHRRARIVTDRSVTPW